MKNLSRSSCIPVLGAEDLDLTVFSELGEQPVSVLELKVSMCLSYLVEGALPCSSASTAVCEGSPGSEEQTRKSGTVLLPLR